MFISKGCLIGEPADCIRSLNISDCNYTVALELCLEVPHITGYLPVTISGIPKGIKLADPKYGSLGEIDLLLGAERFRNILKEGCIHLDKGMPTLQNTVFGHILSRIHGCNFFHKPGYSPEPTLLGDNRLRGLSLEQDEKVICEEGFITSVQKNGQWEVQGGSSY